MKLEDQVCSLELANTLKELGVRQESAFYWHKRMKSLILEDPDHEWVLRGYIESLNYKREDNYSAFTVAELGEMLPNIAKLCYTCRLIDEWRCVYAEEHREGFLNVVAQKSADTEANARAKMLIYLIEQEIIKP